MILLVISVVFLVSVSPSLTKEVLFQDEWWEKGEPLYSPDPVLFGRDVVAYHFLNKGQPGVQGSPELAVNFTGFQFWFSSDTNRRLFLTDPWKWAPAWGGFCSWGIANEWPDDSWPWKSSFLGPPAGPDNGWLIVNGTLIFNIWESYSELFMENVDENMAKARERWECWWGELHAGPFNTQCLGQPDPVSGNAYNWCVTEKTKMQTTWPNDGKDEWACIPTGTRPFGYRLGIKESTAKGFLWFGLLFGIITVVTVSLTIIGLFIRRRRKHKFSPLN